MLSNILMPLVQFPKLCAWSWNCPFAVRKYSMPHRVAVRSIGGQGAGPCRLDQGVYRGERPHDGSARNARMQMLGQALKSWTQNDPFAVANWMNNNNEFGPDLDQGAAQVATTPSLPTQTALAWAEDITDPQLRSATVASVLRDWIYEDASAAQTYLQTTTNLLSADRQQISEVISQRMQPTLAQ